MNLTQQDKQDILRAISDLDERFTRALANMGYDADGKRLQTDKRLLETETVLMDKISSDIEKELTGGI